MSLIAHTVSSIGVFGSARWQNRMSTKSRPNRSSEPSIACRRYLRFSVFVMFTPPWRPQNTFVEITYEWRGQPSSAIDTAHDRLRLPARVGLGVVEEVDAAVVRGLQAVLGLAAVELRTEAHPRTEPQHADLQPTATQAAIFHRSHRVEPMTLAAMSRFARSLQVDGGPDQTDVTEGLREVAEKFAVARIDLLGEETDVVAALQQPLEELACVLRLAGERQVVDEPEAADRERRLGAGESVGLEVSVDERRRARARRPSRRWLPRRVDRRREGSARVRRAGSTHRARCCRRIARARPVPGSTPRVSIAERISARRRSSGPSRREMTGAASRIARSTATHAMIFDDTKWRRPPRTSQMPSSGSIQRSATTSTIPHSRSQNEFGDLAAGAVIQPRRVEQVPVRHRAGTVRPPRCRCAPASIRDTRPARRGSVPGGPLASDRRT